MEERDSYLLENFSWQNIEPNESGKRIIRVAKADDRLIKREPMLENEYLLRSGKQKIIDFVDLTQDDN